MQQTQCSRWLNEQLHECGDTFTYPSWSFSGPYYNGDGSIIECRWKIISDHYIPITLTIDYLTLNCTHEYILIYNGEPDRSLQLGRVCSGPRSTYISYSGTMQILLHRDSSNPGRGFFAYYDIGVAMIRIILPIAISVLDESGLKHRSQSDQSQSGLSHMKEITRVNYTNPYEMASESSRAI
ncbi:putative DMBT1-like protein [Varanus komodoensis]|nr:putative DMBT1-like protein [Varanus komodoensis]